jgi:hypothetical protein
VPKTKAIVNRFDGTSPAVDRYETRYFKYLGNIRETGGTILDAFRTKNIASIENAIRNLGDSIKNHIFLIGMGCVIIERERLYADAAYSSYLEYARHLYEATGLSPQRISAAKIIVERFLDHHAELKKHGFNLERNSNKLLYLENALDNHGNKNEVFRHIAGDTFREFLAYARTPDGKRALPVPPPKIKIEEGKILIDGKNILNFPAGIPETEKADIGKYLAEVYTIRAAGNEPFILETYDSGERRAIENFLKQHRAKK